MSAFRLQCFAILGVRKHFGQGLLALCLFAGTLSAQEADTFSQILTRQTAKTFELIERYVEEHPEAADRENAYTWLFQTAREQGFEAKALPLANRYLQRKGEDLPAKSLAGEVRTLGLAKSGQWEDALVDFERQLAGVRLRMPTEIVALAKSLAFEAQAAGKPETAKEIYQNLSRSFFLNPEVKQLCETKLAKLNLVGKPAPELGLEDLAGQETKLEGLKGRWVLLDFWATNCPPCLKDLPELKRLYETHHAQGLEILGISLDEDAEVVREFQKSRKLSWRIALSNSDNDKTRENYHVPTIPAMALINPQGQVELIDPTLAELDRFLKSRLTPNAKPSP